VSPRDAAAEDGTSRSEGVAAPAGTAGVGVLAVVDAGVDPAVPAPGAPEGVAAEADDDVGIDVRPKTELGAVVAVVWDAAARVGEPNEKPTLPALGGDDPSLPPGTTPNPNDAGVGDDPVPKANGDGFAGVEPNVPPKMLLGGGNEGNALSFSFSLSLSSADFVVVDAPNMLLGPDEVVVSEKSFVVLGREKENVAGASTDEASLSFSLSFSS
jgi:hypothetical protein